MNAHSKVSSLFLVVSLGALTTAAETWTFTEADDHGDSNYWSRKERWMSQEGGTNGVPQTGDCLEILVKPSSMHRAELQRYMKRVHFGPNGNQNVAHQGFYVQGTEAEPGDFIYEPTAGVSWWCALFVSGTVKVDISSSNVNNGLDSGIQGLAGKTSRIIKLGAGGITSKSGNFPNMSGVDMRQGSLVFSTTSTLKSDLDFWFDGELGSATLIFSGANQNLVNGYLHTATNMAKSCTLGDRSTARTLTLSGNSPVDEQYFEGILAESLSFCWNQTDPTKGFRFAGATSGTTGSLKAESGIVKIGNGASFPSLGGISIGANGEIDIEPDAGLIEARTLTVVTGAKLDIAEGQSLYVHEATLDGQKVPDGEYSTGVPGLTGGGKLVVDFYRGTYGDNQLVLDVPSGEQTLAEAIAAYNAASNTEYTVDDLNGGALKDWTLVKTGEGQLNADVAIGSYQGKVHIKNGTICLTVQLGLGKSNNDSCPIYVHEGATLYSYHPAANNVSFVGESRILHIAGNGFEDKGALRADGVHINYGTVNLFGKQIVVDMDAKIMHHDWYTLTGTLTLRGHTLTIEGITAGSAVLFGTIGDNGYLKLVNSQSRQAPLWINGTGTGNVMEFGNGGGYRFWGSTIEGDGKNLWTFVFNGANTYLYGDTGTLRDSGRNSFGNRWFITNSVNMASQGNTAYSSIFVRGKVSGTGKFVLPTSNEIDILHLMNTENDFSGGASVARGILCAYEDGTLPSSGPVVVNGSSSIIKTGNMTFTPEFYGVALFGVNPCTLPPLQFNGTVNAARIQGGRGAWRSIVKTGSNTMDYFSEAGSPLLDIQAGTVRLPRGAAPGLWEGVVTADAATAFEGTSTPTNMVMRGPTSANQVTLQCPSTPSASKLITYSGYVWNRFGAPFTVTLASSVQGKARIKVDGETVLDAADNTRTFANLTLTPGAHTFEYRAVNGQPTAASDTWPANFGFAVAVGSDVTDTNQFQRCVDPGDGSFFTRSLDNSALPAFDAIRVAKDALLDVNGNRFTATDISGAGKVVSSAADAAIDPALVLKGMTVNAAVQETLTAEVPVVLDSSFKVTVTNCANRIRAGHTLLTATAPITGAPAQIPVVADDDGSWTASLSSDGRSIQVCRTGFALILR